MESIGGYARRAKTTLDFNDTIDKVTELLQEVGFGVLSDLDFQATIKAKLDADIKPTRILGACNPPAAHTVVTSDDLAGVFLPCNVVVSDEGDHRMVTVMDPKLIGTLIENETVREVMNDLDVRMSDVLSRLETL